MTVHRSPRPDIELPRLDILSLLFDSDWCHSKEDDIIHVEAANPDNRISKAEARQLTKRVAYVLRDDYGIGVSALGNDVVLTSLLGSPFAPIFFYGIVAAGGVYSGTSTESHVSEIVRQLKDAGATLVVVSPEVESKAVEAVKQCGILTERLLVLDCNAHPSKWGLIRVSDRQDLLSRNSNKSLDWKRISDQRELEDVTTCLLYSSGTTGLPKGVRLSHWNLVANCVCTMDVARRFKAASQKHGKQPFRFDTIAHLPMSNIAGISLYSTNPFYMGGTTIWMKKYDFESFIEFHRRFRPAYQFTVPPIWLRIAKSDKVTDHFDGLQVAVTGSAPIGFETVKEVQRKLGRGKAQMAQTWGITEAAGVITASDWPAFAEKGSWSVGELCPNVQLRLVDDDDRDVKEEGKLGEFLIQGPIVCQEYHNRPDANRSTFTDDGFYRSGDIGMIQDGLVHILDRKKDFIKYKGAQVAPAELEALLNSHQDIADAAVIGIWDGEQETELPCAYIVEKSPGRLRPQQIADFVKENVASYKQLRGGVIVVQEIPKSASGKILKKDLRLMRDAAEKSKAKL